MQLSVNSAYSPFRPITRTSVPLTCSPACPMCAKGKSSHQPPAGLLQPLEIPRCPWLHIVVMWLITGFPSSEAHQIILTMTNHFSKAAKFIPLPMLPSAVETMELLVPHILVGDPAYTVRSIVDIHHPSYYIGSWSTRRGMARRSNRGSTSTAPTWTSLVGHLGAPVEGEAMLATRVPGCLEPNPNTDIPIARGTQFCLLCRSCSSELSYHP